AEIDLSLQVGGRHSSVHAVRHPLIAAYTDAGQFTGAARRAEVVHVRREIEICWLVLPLGGVQIPLVVLVAGDLTVDDRAAQHACPIAGERPAVALSEAVVQAPVRVWSLVGPVERPFVEPVPIPTNEETVVVRCVVIDPYRI